MKKRPYCGAEYPDDTPACPIDQTPLGEAPSETISEALPRKFPIFAVVSEKKVPVSLVIISYLFLIPGAMYLSVIIFIIILSFFGGFPGGFTTWLCIFAAPIAVFFFLLSRGLRRCSPGWRICALVLTWWGFLVIAFKVGYFLTHGATDGESTLEFLVTYALGIIIQIWQYRVLTRPDVRELFYGKPDHSSHFQ